jgi:hypothetical protein
MRHDPITRYHFVYAILGLFIGALTILGGLILFLNGVTGKVSLITKTFGVRTEVPDAAPGVVFAVVGAWIVYVTRFEIGRRPSRTNRRTAKEQA